MKVDLERWLITPRDGGHGRLPEPPTRMTGVMSDIATAFVAKGASAASGGRGTRCDIAEGEGRANGDAGCIAAANRPYAPPPNRRPDRFRSSPCRTRLPPEIFFAAPPRLDLDRFGE